MSALKACDTQVLDQILAQDYRGYDIRGQAEDRELILETFCPGTATLDELRTEDCRIEVFGEVGLITGKGSITGTWMGHSWSHRVRFSDLFLHREGSWQLYSSQMTEMDEESDAFSGKQKGS
jgi:ketosteroid isomerase-like protein